MSKRLDLLNSHFNANIVASKKQPTLNVWESLYLDSLLRPETVQKRKATSEMMKSIYPSLIPAINDTSFPFETIIPAI